eukprot:362183-Chlamydomonas_euryale.AAC.4
MAGLLASVFEVSFLLCLLAGLAPRRPSRTLLWPHMHRYAALPGSTVIFCGAIAAGLAGGLRSTR